MPAGKSGSVFFLSDDDKYLIKTMRKSEMKLLRRILPAYFSHISSNGDTLITRFFGLHRVQPHAGRCVRFVVMANMFQTDLQIHRKYDIKGSTEGRTLGPRADDNDPSLIFKDLDLDFKIQLDPAWYRPLMTQLHADAEFLKQAGALKQASAARCACTVHASKLMRARSR